MSSFREIVYEDKDICVNCDYLFNKDKIVLHLDIEDGKWSHSKYKELKGIFEILKERFRKEGYSEIYGVPTKDDDRAKKLILMFGFEEICKSNGLIIMRIKIN
jgi:hypothetical protein